MNIVCPKITKITKKERAPKSHCMLGAKASFLFYLLSSASLLKDINFCEYKLEC